MRYCLHAWFIVCLLACLLYTLLACLLMRENAVLQIHLLADTFFCKLTCCAFFSLLRTLHCLLRVFAYMLTLCLLACKFSCLNAILICNLRMCFDHLLSKQASLEIANRKLINSYENTYACKHIWAQWELASKFSNKFYKSYEFK